MADNDGDFKLNTPIQNDTLAERRANSKTRNIPSLGNLTLSNVNESDRQEDENQQIEEEKEPTNRLAKDEDVSESDDDSSSDSDDGEERTIAVKAIPLPAPPSFNIPGKEDLRRDSFAFRTHAPHTDLTPQDVYNYEVFRKKMIYPATAFDHNGNLSDEIPYTGVNEEARDAQKAKTLHTEISQICSDQEGKRMFRTIERGDVPAMDDMTEKESATIKSYLVCTDLSPEAAHAMEWTIGTILRDNSILFAVSAMEDNPDDPAPAQEGERLDICQKITEQVVSLLNKTRLQVHVVIEVIHTRRPKHLLTEIIDYISPTLVVLGSRGRSALQGVLLGSFSNYIVEKSSVPVMVARRKLHKLKNRSLRVRLTNNLRSPEGPEDGFNGQTDVINLASIT